MKGGFVVIDSEDCFFIDSDLKEFDPYGGYFVMESGQYAGVTCVGEGVSNSGGGDVCLHYRLLDGKSDNSTVTSFTHGMVQVADNGGEAAVLFPSVRSVPVVDDSVDFLGSVIYPGCLVFTWAGILFVDAVVNRDGSNFLVIDRDKSILFPDRSFDDSVWEMDDDQRDGVVISGFRLVNSAVSIRSGECPPCGDVVAWIDYRQNIVLGVVDSVVDTVSPGDSMLVFPVSDHAARVDEDGLLPVMPWVNTPTCCVVQLPI